jgi:hypothetical protein
MVIRMNMTTHGKMYNIDSKNYDKLEGFIEHARDEMNYPYMFHFLSHICDADEFKKSKRNLIKDFERGLKRKFKGSQQSCPDVQVAYSIEFKYTNDKEINGKEDAYNHKQSKSLKPKPELPFLHIHFYVIADCRKANVITFKDNVIASLNDIKGLRAGRYFPSKNGELYKQVKADYDDCFQRILYIAKIDQKSPEIPFNKKFGMSKIPVLS